MPYRYPPEFRRKVLDLQWRSWWRVHPLCLRNSAGGSSVRQPGLACRRRTGHGGVGPLPGQDSGPPVRSAE